MIAEIVALPLYESQVSDLLTEDERSAMEYYVAMDREGHPVIPASRGFRRARWTRAGQIFMASIYAKSREEILASADSKVLAKLAARIKQAAREGSSK